MKFVYHKGYSLTNLAEVLNTMAEEYAMVDIVMHNQPSGGVIIKVAGAIQ